MAGRHGIKPQIMQYKNKAVETIMRQMMESLPEFNTRRKAGQWKGIIFALAETFPEDREQMYSEAFSKPEGPRRKTKAKITRSKPKTAAGKKPPCPDCPPAVFGRSGFAAGSNTPAPRVAKAGTADKEQASEPSKWGNVDEVLEAFEGSTEAMLAYCQASGVNLPPNIKDPKKIAGYIVNHENPDQ